MGSWNTAKLTAPHLLKSAQKYPGTGKSYSQSISFTQLMQCQGGRIIFISSTLQYTGIPLNTHGAVAKSGVDALSAQLAIELGPQGITSNVISPGVIEGTEGQKRLFKPSKENIQRTPLGRMGTVKDVNNATIYLFSDVGDYINGTVQVGKLQQV